MSSAYANSITTHINRIKTSRDGISGKLTEMVGFIGYEPEFLHDDVISATKLGGFKVSDTSSKGSIKLTADMTETLTVEAADIVVDGDPSATFVQLRDIRLSGIEQDENVPTDWSKLADVFQINGESLSSLGFTASSNKLDNVKLTDSTFKVSASRQIQNGNAISFTVYCGTGGNIDACNDAINTITTYQDTSDIYMDEDDVSISEGYRKGRQLYTVTELATLRTEVTELTDTKTTLETQVADLTVTKTTLEGQVTELTNTKTDLETEIAGLESELADIENELASI